MLRRFALAAAALSSGRGGGAELVRPAWEWEPREEQTVQHCLQVATVNGSWNHEVLNSSGRGPDGQHQKKWISENQSISWVNNSRLLSLAVPEGSPPPGGWPVLMDLLVVDYPSRLSGVEHRGVDKATAQQICGLDGALGPTAAGGKGHKNQAAKREKCAAAIRAQCGHALNSSFVDCVRCGYYNATHRNATIEGGNCTNGLLHELLFTPRREGSSLYGGICPAPAPAPPRCNQSMQRVCGWTQAIRDAAAKSTDPREREHLWVEYSRNCSRCVQENFKLSQPNVTAAGCPFANGSDVAGPMLLEFSQGFCQTAEPPWHHKQQQQHNAFFTSIRYFWPFSSPQRLAMGCSCINTSSFTCAPPHDDGHLGQEYVPPGGFCDSDVFFGAVW